MKLSVTNEKELKAALNHLMYAKSEVVNVAAIIEKRGENADKLFELYKNIYRAHDALDKLLRTEILVVYGGK